MGGSLSSQPGDRISCHATCVVVGEAGLLIRGPSGSGKSTLARQIIAKAHAAGHFARLVGDDRVLLENSGGRIIARGHPIIAGQIEIRRLGIAQTNFEDSVVIRLLVDCQDVISSRVPDAENGVEPVMGVSLRRIEVQPSDADLVLIAVGFGNMTVQM